MDIAKLDRKNYSRIEKEKRLIESMQTPVTVKMIVDGLRKLGIRPGMSLITHISLSSLGWVCGGPQAIIESLMEVVTREGNIIMSAYTGYNSNPASWKYPPVPKKWLSVIREHLPVYDKEMSHPSGMGKIVECFRAIKDVERSNHPRSSFLAWGKNKADIISNENYDFPFGIDSPLGKAYKLGSYILMIGVDYNIINSFYFAYYLACIGNKPIETCKSVIDFNGKRRWIKYRDYQRDISIFKDIYMDFIHKGSVNIHLIGNAECKLIEQKSLVDFAKEQLEINMNRMRNVE